MCGLDKISNLLIDDRDKTKLPLEVTLMQEWSQFVRMSPPPLLAPTSTQELSSWVPHWGLIGKNVQTSSYGKGTFRFQIPRNR